jgi:hypothetical protein
MFGGLCDEKAMSNYRMFAIRRSSTGSRELVTPKAPTAKKQMNRNEPMFFHYDGNSRGSDSLFFLESIR